MARADYLLKLLDRTSDCLPLPPSKGEEGEEREGGVVAVSVALSVSLSLSLCPRLSLLLSQPSLSLALSLALSLYVSLSLAGRITSPHKGRVFIRNCFANALVSHKVFLKSFCKCQYPQKSVNLFIMLVIAKDELTDLWGS